MICLTRALPVPLVVLAVPDKPLFPASCASNAAVARYLARSEEWMDAALCQISLMAGTVCTLTGLGCQL
ncbi:hypothetical protein [Shimia isoporae]|uniref:hypothetical protein n=1 Tax=Shimia isoporae TaxID=647720 RepID=UPI00104E25BD|nr:hypothetical protein [Shimia isoporae]